MATIDTAYTGLVEAAAKAIYEQNTNRCYEEDARPADKAVHRAEAQAVLTELGAKLETFVLEGKTLTRWAIHTPWETQ
jgi:hypothetical protein